MSPKNNVDPIFTYYYYLIYIAYLITQLYKSSYSAGFFAWFEAVGHLIVGPLLPAFETKLGSNFLLNCSNFSRSKAVTDFLAPRKAYSKCLRVISGTGSKF